MEEERVRANFEITDLSKGLSMEDIQNANFTLFSTPMSFPENEVEAMTLEEFILGKRKHE